MMGTPGPSKPYPELGEKQWSAETLLRGARVLSAQPSTMLAPAPTQVRDPNLLEEFKAT